MQAPVPMITAQRLKGNDAGPRKRMFSMELSYPFLAAKTDKTRANARQYRSSGYGLPGRAPFQGSSA